jgi:hypothetical protein
MSDLIAREEGLSARPPVSCWTGCRRVLDELERVAAVEFGNEVEPLLTALYTARRPS